jgi:hypothetical protein
VTERDQGDSRELEQALESIAAETAKAMAVLRSRGGEKLVAFASRLYSDRCKQLLGKEAEPLGIFQTFLHDVVSRFEGETLRRIVPDVERELLALIGDAETDMQELGELETPTARRRSVAIKQNLASEINALMKQNDMIIVGPNGGDSIILAINDKYGGKFVFSDLELRKRSGSKKNIRELLPLSVHSTLSIPVYVTIPRPVSGSAQTPPAEEKA